MSHRLVRQRDSIDVGVDVVWKLLKVVMMLAGQNSYKKWHPCTVGANRTSHKANTNLLETKSSRRCSRMPTARRGRTHMGLDREFGGGGG